MTPLATEIYKQLRAHLRKQNSITYGRLAELVSKKHETHHRSGAFHAALTEVIAACRDAELPCLCAIVWSSTTNRPSAGYYKYAHPRSKTDGAKLAAWEREHAAVIRDAAKYPTQL